MIYCRVLDPAGRQVVNYRPYARVKRYYRSVDLTAIFGSEAALCADFKHGNGKMGIIAPTRAKLLPLRTSHRSLRDCQRAILLNRDLLIRTMHDDNDYYDNGEMPLR